MNGKAAKLIRKLKGGKRQKRQWQSFPHTLRGKIRADYQSDPKLIYRATLWPSE